MGRVIHFEIHADDPERAVGFYSELFGWEVTRWGEEEYWLAATGPEGEAGINGAFLKRRGDRPEVGAPTVGAVITVQVDDIDAALAKASELGGQLAVAKMDIPGVGTVAYVIDTEANVVGMLQPVG